MLVDQPVMERAHESEVVEIRGAKASPVIYVMGVQEPLRLTPWKRAASVALLERTFLPDRWVPE